MSVTGYDLNALAAERDMLAERKRTMDATFALNIVASEQIAAYAESSKPGAATMHAAREAAARVLLKYMNEMLGDTK